MMGVEHDNSGYSISASGSSISTSGSESGGRMYCWSTNLSQVSGSGRSQLMMGQVPWPLGAGKHWPVTVHGIWRLSGNPTSTSKFL